MRAAVPVALRPEIRVVLLVRRQPVRAAQLLLDRQMRPVKPNSPWPSRVGRLSRPMWQRRRRAPTPVLQMVESLLPQVAGQAPDRVGAGLMARPAAQSQLLVGPKAAPMHQSPESVLEILI